jgi:hypothetical protein
LRLGGFIQFLGELRKSRQIPVLGQFQAELSGYFLHGGDLGGAAHTGYGKSHVHGRPLAFVEKIRLQIDLAVGDGK